MDNSLKCRCQNCKFFDEDFSTGTSECLSERITEECLDKHFTEDKPNCPYWVEAEEYLPKTITEYERQAEEVLYNYNIHATAEGNPKDNTISVEIQMGDWKHEHRKSELILKKIGLEKIDEVITESTDSDCYSAIYKYMIMDEDRLELDTEKCPTNIGSVGYYISAKDVRQICIDYSWYTCGTNEDYKKMLNYCNSTQNNVGDMTDFIYTIAKDILNHSSDDEVDVESIMSIIASRAIRMAFN